MVGTEAQVAELESLTEKLYSFRLVACLHFQGAELDQRREVLRRAVASSTGHARAVRSIRESAVARPVGEWRIPCRINATVEADSRVGHTLDPPTVIRLNGWNDFRSRQKWRLDRAVAPSNAGASRGPFVVCALMQAGRWGRGV